MDRREILTIAAAGIATAASAYAADSDGAPSGTGLSRAPAFRGGEYVLPPLPYAYNALEPHIDEQTMRLHHDRHHAAYVAGLNKAVSELAAARKSGDFALVKHWEREAAFHGSGHILHCIFWENMAPNTGGEPTGDLASAISEEFGDFAAFKRQFSAASVAVEGSGWGLLVYDPFSARLRILQAEKHQDLTMWGAVPLLVLDVWEHAYYLKYQNRRADYVSAWWNLVNWADVGRRLTAARRLSST